MTLVFHIFPCGAREWCARRGDGLVCGYFVDQPCAIRFARRETCGTGAIIVHNAPQLEPLLRKAA